MYFFSILRDAKYPKPLYVRLIYVNTICCLSKNTVPKTVTVFYLYNQWRPFLLVSIVVVTPYDGRGEIRKK